MQIDYSLFPGRYRKAKEYDKELDPIISIITPYYNTNKYIDTTVNSVLNQTFTEFEWIIVDDGSTNKKDLEKLEELEKIDTRIKVYHKENEGPSAARDFGAKKISNKSKYIIFLDSDDLIVETYLECAYWTLETNPKASWAYTDTINFGGQNFEWAKWYNPYKEMDDNILVMTAIIRKEAFLKVNGFEIRDKNVYEDWCLWLKLIAEKMFPVRMNFFGFWYRKKPKEESELQQSNDNNKEKAMLYVNNIVKEIKQELKISGEKLKQAIQFPTDKYNWEEIIEKHKNIKYDVRNLNGKINILIIIPWMVTGGADKFNLDIIKRCDKNKYEFIIISTEPSKNNWRQEFEEYATVYDLTTFLQRKDWISFINYIIQKNNINIIFNTNSTFGYASIPYLKVKYPKIPIIDYIHMEEWYNRNGGFSRDSSRISSFIDHTYVCNQNSEKILIEKFNRRQEEVSTIYIGVDEKVFNPELYNKEEICEKLNIEIDDKFVISYICRIAEQKRPFLLLEVIKKLSLEREDFIFIIAGDGPLLDKMKSKARSMKIHKNIKFLGNISNTQDIYAISDLTINCSIKEGLALTSYESLAMGVPVISSDVGGQKELINEDVGIIVSCLQKESEIFNTNYKKDEIESYVHGINTIIKNIKQYKEKSRKRVLSKFTINNMVSNMQNVFDKTLKDISIEKSENAQKMKYNIDLTKEYITRYFICSSASYKWLANEFNEENIDIDNKYENKKRIMYEKTLEYKIKHPIYLVLNKIGIYKYLKIIKKREKFEC